jgi:hypothetical protein
MINTAGQLGAAGVADANSTSMWGNLLSGAADSAQGRAVIGSGIDWATGKLGGMFSNL